MREAIKCAADAYGFKRRDILGRKRTKDVSEARHVAMYLCRPQFSYPEIGRAFKRDHSSVVHAVKRVERTPGILFRAECLKQHGYIPHTIEQWWQA